MSKGMWDLKKLMFAVQGGLCFHCWKPMSQAKEHARAAHYATKDHLLPISHGGTGDWTNTILACLACNRLKANRLPTEAQQEATRPHGKAGIMQAALNESAPSPELAIHTGPAARLESPLTTAQQSAHA